MSRYRREMIRPTLYRGGVRFLLGLVLLLLWDRFINHGLLSVLRDGCFAVGLFMFALAWVSYLRLDGLVSPAKYLEGQKKTSGERGFLFKRKQPTRHSTADISDYTDEHIPTLDELDEEDLDEEERAICTLTANLLCGAIFMAPALISLLLGL